VQTIEPLLVRPDETRNGKILNILGDQLFIKLAARDTGGELSVLQGVTPPQAGPPLHRHTRENETFYIVEEIFYSKSTESSFAPALERLPLHLAEPLILSRMLAVGRDATSFTLCLPELKTFSLS